MKLRAPPAVSEGTADMDSGTPGRPEWSGRVSGVKRAG